MNILLINGSPNINGNTKKLLSLYQDIWKAFDSESFFTMLSLSALRLPLCCGCRQCFQNEVSKCPHLDIISPIEKQMEMADVILIGSPVYVEDISGTMKNAFVAFGSDVISCRNFSTGISMTATQMKLQYQNCMIKQITEIIRRTNEKKVSLFSFIGFSVQKRYYKHTNKAHNPVDFVHALQGVR